MGKSKDNDFLLGEMPPLHGWGNDFLTGFSANAELIHLKNGETLFKQGEAGEHIFLVKDGRLRSIHEHENGSIRALGEIGRGEIVGEMSVITDEQRSATTIAIRKSSVIRLDKKQFANLLHDHPQEALNIMRTLVIRSRKMYRDKETISSVALIPHGPEVEISKFGKDLAKALEAYGSILLLDEKQILELEESALLGWISSQYRKYDLIVFQAEYDQGNWTKRCLSQADKVLIIAKPSSAPELGRIEKALLSGDDIVTSAQKELILLQPDRTKRPQNTGEWLRIRPSYFVHHIANGHDADYGRLARRLMGKSIALVCSGGGAKGYAHIGVMRALREAGIPIDMIGGTSSGAFVGASMVMEWTHEKTMKFMQDLAHGNRQMKDYTLPLLSFFSGKNGTQMAKEYCEGWNIEDLWIPFYCISTSLSQADLVVHTQGPLWKAIRASTAIPGILPPVMVNHDMLVDGGVINNAPVDIMRRFSPGKVLLSNTTAESNFQSDYDFPPGISGWKLLLQKMNPLRKKKKSPGILNVILRSNEVAAKYLMRKTLELHPVDLMLSPPVSEFGMLSYKEFEKIVEAGYRYGLENVEEWKTKLGLT